MTDVSPGLIKGLFHHLIRSAGGVEASAAVLGVSHQRVSQLQLISCPDLPTVMQIVTLEAFVGQPIVTSVLAEHATGGPAKADPLKEAGDAVVMATEAFQAARTGADRPTLQRAAIRLVREAEEFRASVNEAS